MRIIELAIPAWMAGGPAMQGTHSILTLPLYSQETEFAVQWKYLPPPSHGCRQRGGWGGGGGGGLQPPLFFQTLL